MCVLHSRDCDVSPFHCRIRSALDEVNTGNRGKAHQIVHVDLWGLDQSIEQVSLMLGGVNFDPALMVSFKVQPRGRDDSEQSLKWGECDGSLPNACQARGFRAV